MTRTAHDRMTDIPITVTFGTPKEFSKSLKKHGVKDDINVSTNRGYAVKTSEKAGGGHHLFAYISKADWDERDSYATIAHEAFHLLIYIHMIMEGGERELTIYTPQHESFAYHFDTIFQAIFRVVRDAKASEFAKPKKSKMKA
ncbi:hypothetical protein [uncultured Sphaerochaeta sp.]|uniref:hypothetical protein n=1 Tax=uncultured Sphaerochaeta sp. TaxID=886478 RepID=UPI002A0A95EC|nr:hypothetical protein [uncultured Sphaerochaeta sp.]